MVAQHRGERPVARSWACHLRGSPFDLSPRGFARRWLLVDKLPGDLDLLGVVPLLTQDSGACTVKGWLVYAWVGFAATRSPREEGAVLHPAMAGLSRVRDD